MPESVMPLMSLNTSSANALSMLEVKGLSASWEEDVIIQDISFSLEAGKIICLIGRSGSGKTTLLHALAGLNVPNSGEILLLGEDISGNPGHVSYMLQKDLLLEHKIIIDNICLPRLIKGFNKNETKVEATKLLDSFGLRGTENKYPRQLSGGMRQRAALLRTYMMGAKVMLMDEPFSSLDALTREDMQSWFLNIADEFNISGIVITHDINEALMLADEILILGPADATDRLPSTLIGQFDLDCPRPERSDFLLSESAAIMRKEILSILNGNADEFTT